MAKGAALDLGLSYPTCCNKSANGTNRLPIGIVDKRGKHCQNRVDLHRYEGACR